MNYLVLCIKYICTFIFHAYPFSLVCVTYIIKDTDKLFLDEEIWNSCLRRIYRKPAHRTTMSLLEK